MMIHLAEVSLLVAAISVGCIIVNGFVLSPTTIRHPIPPPFAATTTFTRSKRNRKNGRSTLSTTTTTSLAESNGQQMDSEEDVEREKQLLELNASLMQLQAEGVPLLQCDATTVHAFQAALWTTLAQLEESTLLPPENTDEKLSTTRACLIMEGIPVEALKVLVDDFLILKLQQPQMSFLPELEHVSISLVAKGAAPALLLEVAKDDDERTAGPTITSVEDLYNVQSCKKAMSSFVNRVILGRSSTSSSSDASTVVGLGDEGGVAEPLLYRYTPTTNVCSAMSIFWNCICEIQASADGIFNSMCLQLPGMGAEDLGRFCTVAELMSRTMCLYRGDAVLSLVHYHPSYDRATIDPSYKPAYGHLPPMDWLDSMMKKHYSGKGEVVVVPNLTEEELFLSNYQRRSPVPAVMIVKNSALSDPDIVTFEVDGKQQQASGLEVYCPVAVKLKDIGKDAMQEALDAEMVMAMQQPEEEAAS